MRRLITCLAAAALLTSLAVASSATATAAAPKPTISLVSASTRVSARATWTFAYSATHLRRGSHIALQILEQKWVTIERGDAVHGTVHGRIHAQGPGSLGRYVARVAVLRSGHSAVGSARHTVFAYGTVSMTALCHGVLHINGDCEKGTADAGDGTSWHYAMNTALDGSGQTSPEISAPSTSCRSITLRYDGDTGEQNTLVLQQPGVATLKHVSRDDHVQSVQTKLTGGKFTVTVQQDDGELFFYWNGHASCYTATGKA